MTPEPAVSVILPVYNCVEYVAEAVESILQQTFTDYELIIIDDGSKDDSLAVLQRFQDPRIRLYSQSNIGLAATLNRAIELARGALIARQDQDDVSLPTRLEKQVRYMNEHPHVGFLGTWAEIWVERTPTERKHRHAWDVASIRYELLLNNPFVHSSVMFRRDLVRACGGYCVDRKRQPPEDFELWSRLIRRADGANLPEILLIYREIPRSMSRAGQSPFLRNVVKIVLENLSHATGLQPRHPGIRQIAALAHGGGDLLDHQPDFLTMLRVYRRAVRAVIPPAEVGTFLNAANLTAFDCYCAYWEPILREYRCSIVFRAFRKIGYTILQWLHRGSTQA